MSVLNLTNLDDSSLNDIYLSMKDSIIDVTQMDCNGISCLKQFVYENGESGDVLKMNVSLNDEKLITTATFVEDGYSNPEITSNILLPFEGKEEDQTVTIGDNLITYEHDDNKMYVDGVQRTIGDSFILAGRNVTIAKGSVVIVLEDTLQKDFPYDGLQSEIVNNSGSVTYGDVSTTTSILIESKESIGDTLVSSYVFFIDPVTDHRSCSVEYIKSVDLAQTSCTSRINVGHVDSSNNESVEPVLDYSSQTVNITNIDSFTSGSNISTLDVNGISFDSNTAGIILGDSTKFGIFYDEVNDTLQIKYYDDISGEYVVKKEFSN